MSSKIKPKLSYAYLLSIALLILGCNNSSVDEELRIDLTSNFNNDEVSISLNEKEIFSGRITTSPALGLAEIIVLNYPTGRQKLTFNMNGTIVSKKFRHKKDQFIYISFDATSSKIEIEISKKEAGYD